MSDDQATIQTLIDWLSLTQQRVVHDALRYNKAAGLSISQMNILMWLHYHATCEINTLAEMMQSSSAAASQIIDRMAQQDLVERVQDPSDRRHRHIHLTPQGKAIIEKAIQARERWIYEVVKDMDETQKQATQQVIAMLIEKVNGLGSLPH